MKFLWILLLSCLCATANPIACKYCAKDGFLTVTWCNLTAGSDWFVEWSDNATDWLIESPTSFDGTVTIELEMTGPMQFVRLVEYPNAMEQRETKGTN